MDSFGQFDGLRPSMLGQDRATFYEPASIKTLLERIHFDGAVTDIRCITIQQRDGVVSLSFEFTSPELEKKFLDNNGMHRLQVAAESLVRHAGNPFHAKHVPHEPEETHVPASQADEGHHHALEGYAPQPEDFGGDGRGNLRDPKSSAAARHASQMQEHMAASRRLFLDERDRIWEGGEVNPDTPFKYGHPPRPPAPPRRLTDDELRRGEMPRTEAIMHRARRIEPGFPEGRLTFEEFPRVARAVEEANARGAQEPTTVAQKLAKIRRRHAPESWAARTDDASENPDKPTTPHR